MKRVLITGANSYVGTNVEKWLMNEPDKYYVETLDMKDPNWREFDFSKFDVVFHVAGIAHVSVKKHMKDLYFKVNKDLAIETANKAKESGVKHFIFMSSMIVYSSKDSIITSETIPNPDNFYGLSKLLAENEINKISSEKFSVTIVRPPMIYGPKSKGNFNSLIKYSPRLFFVPKISNMRSILYIDNLSIFIELVIDKNICGTLFPRNIMIVSTNDIISTIKMYRSKTYRESYLLGILVKISINYVGFIKKIYGSRYYDNSIDTYSDNSIDLIEYNHTDFKESVGQSIE